MYEFFRAKLSDTFVEHVELASNGFQSIAEVIEIDGSLTLVDF